MNKYMLISAVAAAIIVSACGRNDQPQYVTQPQYAPQPQPQVVYQQPQYAPQPQVVYQQPPQVVYQQQPNTDHTIAAGVLGAAVGAAAATAYHNSKTPAAPAPRPQYSAGTPRQYNATSRTPAPQPATVVQRSAPAPKPAVAPKPAPAPKPVFTPSKVVAPRTFTKGK